MRKVLKWVGIVIGGLLALIVLAVAAAYFIVGERLTRTYEIKVEAVPVPEGINRTERDWPLVLIGICEDCHGIDLAGQVLSDDAFGRFSTPNLTSGSGGIGAEYTDADWVRTIRHGVDPDGRPLVVMPAQEFYNLSDADLGEIIAYVKSAPPVDKESPDLAISPLGRAFIAAGLFPDPIPAEIIDHTAERPPEPVPGVTAEYGKYMTFVCTVCHLEDFSGGPDAGQGMNLTPGGRLGEWTKAEFINTIRTGVAPDGQELDPDEMPWRDIRRSSDDQLRAIWLYLQSLPPVVTEHR